MLHGEATGLLVGAVALGAVHGIEPGHGWPVAASYALDQSHRWLYGFAASLIIGVGHLVSSVAMVAVFFYAKSYFELTQVNEPMTLVGVEVGGPVSVVAGALLIALGVREYTHGHSHGGEGLGHGHDGDDHSHDDHRHAHSSGDRSRDDHGRPRANDDHSRSHDDGDDGILGRIRESLPFGGGHSHDHGSLDGASDRGLLGIAWFAFVLGFAHEEEFEIIALCAGSTHCLELMTAYALTVVVGIVGLTLLLVAGYQRYEERVERYAEYLPAFSAAVLTVMGVGFVLGLF